MMTNDEPMRTKEAGRHDSSAAALYVARLYRDSLALEPNGTRRGDAASEVRQLAFTTEVADVSLSVVESIRAMGLSVLGQVLPKSDRAAGSFKISLLEGTLVVGATTADDLGEFALDAVPPGDYRMLLTTDALSIVIASLNLGLRPAAS